MKKSNAKNSRRNMSAELHFETKSVLFWLVIGFVAIFLFIAPFYQGLFNGGHVSFEGEIYMAVMLSMIALFCLAIYFFRNWQLKDIRDVLSLTIWLVPFSFVISYFNAASPHATMISIYIHVMYAAFFLIGLYLTRISLGSDIVVHAFVLSGYVLVFHGFLHWFGLDAYENTVLDTRLAGVFQYPNTYGAYLIALYFSAIILAQTAKHWSVSALHAFMLVPVFPSFLLTLSRGALISLPIVLVVFLLLLPLKKQVTALLMLFFSGISSFMIIKKLTAIRFGILENLDPKTQFAGWAILVAAALAGTIGAMATTNVIESKMFHAKIHPKSLWWRNVVLPASLILLAVIGFILILNSKAVNLLPVTFQSQLQNNASIWSRAIFYQDSFELFKDYFWTGAGGGAWSHLYEGYKSIPYTSRQAHNFLLQYADEVGIFGLLFILTIAGFIVICFMKTYWKKSLLNETNNKIIFFIVPVSILLHSLLDFDMTFVYLGAMVFFCFGAMGAEIELKKFDMALLKLQVRKAKHKIMPALLATVAVISFFSTFQSVKADQLYNKAMDELNISADFSKIMNFLDRAIVTKPNHPEYVRFKVNLLRGAYLQTQDEKYYREATALIEKLREKEAYNKELLVEHIELLINGGEFDAALALLTEANDRYIWEISLYEKRLSLLIDRGNQYQSQNPTATAGENHYWQEALNVFDHVERKKNYSVENLPDSIKSMVAINFELNPGITLSVAQIHYFNQNYEKTARILEKIVSTDFNEPINQEIARWYLAALMKLNKDDKNLYNALIQADRSEAEKIQELLEI